MTPHTLLRALPPKLAERFFYRFFNLKQKKYVSLFQSSQLRLAPEYRMTGLVAGDVISGQIAFNGFYEYELSKAILRLSKEGGLFVDVGANIGYFTLLWLSGNSNNKAFSIEPAPRNQNLLAENIAANSLHEKVEIIPKAAGDSAKTVSFDLGPEEQTGWGGLSSGTEGRQSVEVDMVRIDEIVTTPIAVMKIDVEGADTLVIKGCEKLLKEKMIGTIFFEQNDKRMERLGLKDGIAQASLESFGYKCERLSADEWKATIS